MSKDHATSTQDLWGELQVTFVEYSGNYMKHRAVSSFIS
jgi:hypothetical protein